MLGKLFRYEWKASAQMLFIVHAFMLIFAGFSRITIAINGGLNGALKSGSVLLDITVVVLISFSIMIVGGVALFTYVYLAYRFYKNVFTDQGYLTNTLPVTPVQIILSKGFTGVLWILIDALILCLSLICLFATGDFFSGLGAFFSELLDYVKIAPVSSCLTLFCVILNPFALLMQIYFCVAVGNLFSGHKVLGATATFFGVYMLQQIISLLFLVITGWNTLAQTPNNLIFIRFQKMLNVNLTIGLLFNIAYTLIFWFSTKYIMTKKLNLQ